jgi:hypothetical protein
MRNIKLFIFLTFVITFQQILATEGRDVSASGYIFNVPEGWSFNTVPSQPFKVASAPGGDGTANIMFKTGQIPTTYDAWINAMIKGLVPGLSRSFSNVRIINTQGFSTNEQLNGTKVEFEYIREDGGLIHQCDLTPINGTVEK